MVTSGLLEAFLACPVKCHLLSEGEVPAGTEYPAWAAAREESCRREGVRKLTSQETGTSIAAAEPGLWKHESWRFAVGKTVRAEGWEAEIALIQRIQLTGAPSRFVPIRFAANNKLSASDKTMAAFEAIALAKALGTKTGTVKIVHGEKPAMVSVNAAALSRAVHRNVSQVASLLSAVSPPDTVVNRHCPECGFHRKLPLPVDSKNWTFLAGFCAGGKSDEEVAIHRIADRGDPEGRGGRVGVGAAGAQVRDQRGDLLPLEVEVRQGWGARAQAAA